MTETNQTLNIKNKFTNPIFLYKQGISKEVEDLLLKYLPKEELEKASANKKGYDFYWISPGGEVGVANQDTFFRTNTAADVSDENIFRTAVGMPTIELKKPFEPKVRTPKGLASLDVVLEEEKEEVAKSNAERKAATSPSPESFEFLAAEVKRLSFELEGAKARLIAFVKDKM